MDLGGQLPIKRLPYQRCRHRRLRSTYLARLAIVANWARWPPVDWQTVRMVLGHVVCLSWFLAPWHVLPVFLDLKIAKDPNLPGLTEENLPITTTAIFLGWLAGSLCLKHLMENFSKEQLVAGSACGLCIVTLATVTLLHLTAGSLVIFTCIRFVYGILMNVTGIQIVYIQELMPGRENKASVVSNIGYSLVLILMSWICRGPTFSMDWRLEAILWNGLPMVLGLVLAFPNLPEISKNHHTTSTEKTLEMKGKDGKAFPAVLEPVEPVFSMDTIYSMLAFMVSFLACGCGFYGLSYSAGKLSSDVHLSTMLLSGADILGYVTALSADSLGRTRVQGACFALAACCLFLCSIGEPGSLFVILPAMVGRLCLDICFTTVYVGLVETFSEAAQTTVLPACEITARLGGIVAPYCGTLPLYASCQIFGFICIAAAGASAMQEMQVPLAPSASAQSLSKCSTEEALQLDGKVV